MGRIGGGDLGWTTGDGAFHGTQEQETALTAVEV